MTSRTKLKRKPIDDVMGGQDFGADETDGMSTQRVQKLLDRSTLSVPS